MEAGNRGCIILSQNRPGDNPRASGPTRVGAWVGAAHALSPDVRLGPRGPTTAAAT